MGNIPERPCGGRGGGGGVGVRCMGMLNSQSMCLRRFAWTALGPQMIGRCKERSSEATYQAGHQMLTAYRLVTLALLV